MKDAKYVVGEVNNNGLPVMVAIVFPRYIPHDAVKDVFLPGTISSAGFFQVNKSMQIVVYGESVGLGVCARVNDEKLISRAIGLLS